MKSYLKFLSRNKLYTAIEFIGLAVSLAFVILIGSYVRQQQKAAYGYPEWKKTYLVGTLYGSVEMGPRTGLAGLLKENVPEIDKAADYSYLGIKGKVGDVPIHHNGMIAEVTADFLDMFPIQWVSGNPDELLESNTVAVKERFAREMFPGEDVIGKVWEYEEEVSTVVAVFRDFGSPIFRDDELVLLEVRENGELIRGYTGVTTCFVRSDESEDKLMADIDAVLENHHRMIWAWGRDETRAMKNGSIERMDRLYFSDLNGGNQFFLKGNKSLLKMLSAVVLLLLLSAIFNYINLSSALAGRRVKEMGMRSVLGASREQIVWNYLKESLVFTGTDCVELPQGVPRLHCRLYGGSGPSGLCIPASLYALCRCPCSLFARFGSVRLALGFRNGRYGHQPCSPDRPGCRMGSLPHRVPIRRHPRHQG